jgi:DNA-directed RNA polymerase specialized sigma subunit
MTVDPGLLRRAEQAARQYRTEHGTPITAGQLAARLRVNSEQAAQALAVINLGPNSPTDPIPTANGRPVKATR